MSLFTRPNLGLYVEQPYSTLRLNGLDIPDDPIPRPTQMRRVQQTCPFRGYPEFYVAAREFPGFAQRCADPIDWVSHVALTLRPRT